MPLLRINNWLYFNQICFLCQIRKSNQIGLCDGCLADLPYLYHPCPRCALPRSDSNAVCTTCINSEFAFDSAWAPLIYTFPLGAVFAQIKRGKNPNALRWMTKLFIDLIPEQPHLSSEYTLIPVPMHSLDRLTRGFNQTEIIGRQLASALSLHYRDRLLTKTRRTAHQVGLNRQQRLSNLTNSFNLNAAPPTKVILIDDVMTTGATASCLANLLKSSGCQQVHLWTLCRTL